MRRTVDPFTYASPHYQAALRTCDRAGPALQVTAPPALSWRCANLAVRLLAALGFVAAVLTALACLSAG